MKIEAIKIISARISIVIVTGLIDNGFDILTFE